MDGVTEPMASQMISAGLADVDWKEIQEHYETKNTENADSPEASEVKSSQALKAMGGPIAEHKFEDIGIEHPDYFQGRGVMGTEFDMVFVGIGDSLKEAADDALDQAAGTGYELTESINAEAEGLSAEVPADLAPSEDENDPNQLYYHAAFYVKDGVSAAVKGEQESGERQDDHKKALETAKTLTDAIEDHAVADADTTERKEKFEKIAASLNPVITRKGDRRKITYKSYLKRVKALKNKTHKAALVILGYVPEHWDVITTSLMKDGVLLTSPRRKLNLLKPLRAGHTLEEIRMIAASAGVTMGQLHGALEKIKAQKPLVPKPADDAGPGKVWAWDSEKEAWYSADASTG